MRLASLIAVLMIVAAVAAVLGGVFAAPADAGVHCYFGENLWGGFWYCVSW